MTNRLVSFGCSHTYGDSLFDEASRTNRNIKEPSKYAWPNVLAQQLNKKCINLSCKGASNKEICYRILNTNFFTEDYVLLLWTHTGRTCILQDNFAVKQLHSHDKAYNLKESKIYYANFYTECDAIQTDFFYINLANLYLQSLNLDLVVNLLISDDMLNNNFVPTLWNKVNFQDFYFKEFLDSYPKAYDGSHMGEEGHIAYANQIFHKFFK